MQVGTQRRSTPHLIEARDRIVREGKLCRSGSSRFTATTSHAAKDNPPDSAPPENLDYEMWTVRTAETVQSARPFRDVCERSWSMATGIVVRHVHHMLDMVRWMLDLDWPERMSSTGGILVQEGLEGQHQRHPEATFDFGSLKSCGSTAPGAKRLIPSTVGRDDLWRQRHAQGQCEQL